MYGTWGNKKEAIDSTAPFRYSVIKGDTLKSIALKTKQNEKKIRDLNPLIFCGKNTTVYPGQELIVDDSFSVSLPPPPELIDNGWGEMHVVRAGDTIKSIALEYNTSEEYLRNDNRQYFPQGERGILFPGQMLHIRIVNTQQEEEETMNAIYHTIKKFDTFESLSNQYNTTKSRLLLRNKSIFPIGKRPILIPGENLIVGYQYENNQDCHIGEIILKKQIHHVQYGETPEIICNLYNMTLDELREYNRVYFPKGYRGEIQPNYKLVVKRSISNEMK